MLYSMTGYGRCRGTLAGRDISVELRSVNNRFFDCVVRLPRAYACLEEKVRPYLQSKGVSRGKVEVNISIERLDSPEFAVSLDSGYAAGYVAALRRLAAEQGLRDDISVMGVAQNRDLFKTTKPDEDAGRDWQALLPVFDDAVGSFLAARAAEGGRLEADIRSKLSVLRGFAGQVAALSEDEKSAYRARLEARLREALADHKVSSDENRILTECAIFADRVSVDEELVRLDSHFKAFEAALDSGEPTGRRLDFLLQELGREVNTIGSKCSSSEISHIVVDCKCELEKIREQIQNIE